MCGISFHAHLGKISGTGSGEFAEFLHRLRVANARRGSQSIFLPSFKPDSSSDPQGPDVQQHLDVLIRRSDDNPVSGGDIPLHFFASELQLRGTDIAKQPHHDADSQNILCWNGEVVGLPSPEFPHF